MRRIPRLTVSAAAGYMAVMSKRQLDARLGAAVPKARSSVHEQFTTLQNGTHHFPGTRTAIILERSETMWNVDTRRETRARAHSCQTADRISLFDRAAREESPRRRNRRKYGRQAHVTTVLLRESREIRLSDLRWPVEPCEKLRFFSSLHPSSSTK